MLKLQDGSMLQPLNKNAATFRDSFIAIYGARNTGKTTALFEIMYHLREDIIYVYVLCQSAEANNQFKEKVPSSAVKTDMNKEWFSEMLKQQKIRAGRYRRCNELSSLREVFKLVATRSELNIEKNLYHFRSTSLKNIESDDALSEEDKTSYAKIVRDRNDSLLHMHYTKVIKTNREKFKTMRLSSDQVEVLKFMDPCPRLLLIFDDCASIFSEWARTNSEISEMIYNGRHYYITMIITTQDDTDISKKFRKQATFSIFTDQIMAMSDFSRSERKGVQKRAAMCISALWSQKKSVSPSERKLVYSSYSDTGDNFSYMSVGYRTGFKVGSKRFWDNCEKER